MTMLAAAGYISDCAGVCGGALSNLWNGEKGAVQQPCAAHEGVAACALPPAPVKMVPSVAKASIVVVTRRRFVRMCSSTPRAAAGSPSNQGDFVVGGVVSYPRVRESWAWGTHNLGKRVSAAR